MKQMRSYPSPDLKLNRIVEEGVIRPTVRQQREWEWRDQPADEKPSASLGFDDQTVEDSWVPRLRHFS
jgi:hypothetical protein